MRAVIQRVNRASVSVDGQTVGAVEKGLLVFLGVADGDNESDADYIADKLAGLRVFPDENGRMNRNVSDAGGGLLVVSQFTLYGDCRRGKRPSFDHAADPQVARSLYEYLLQSLRARAIPVESGIFQAAMSVELINDGPVTILLDSSKLF